MKVPQTLCSLWVSLYLFVKTLVVSQELRVFEYNWSKLSERKTICQLNTVFNVCNLKRKEADVLILFFGAVTLRLSCLSVGGFVIRYCKPIIPVFPWVPKMSSLLYIKRKVKVRLKKKTRFLHSNPCLRTENFHIRIVITLNWKRKVVQNIGICI